MDSKKKTLFMIIAGIVVIVALVWKVAIPLVDEANKLGGDIKGYQGEISKFASYTNYMADLKASYKNNEEKIGLAGATIITDTEAGKLGLLKEVESISDKTSNVLQANISKEAAARKNVKSSSANKNAKTEPVSMYTDFSLNLRLRGTFSTLIKMLIEMENMPYYNNIDTISISGTADSKYPDLTTDSNIKLKVFTRPKTN